MNEGRLEIDGVSLEFAQMGPTPDETPTIVMLHEGLGSLALWRDFPERIAKATGLGVLVYSRAGYGRSDPIALPRPLDYMTREAKTLGRVLDASGVKQAILLGHSDGATIAAIYAGSVVDMRVRGLILMAPHFFAESQGLQAIAKAKAAFETGDLAERLGKYHDHVEVAFRGWCDAWLDLAFKDWNVSEVIDYLRIPTLAIQGAKDAYGTRAQIDELQDRSYAPVDVMWLSECGHAPHQDHPDVVLNGIVEYCARLVAIEAAHAI